MPKNTHFLAPYHYIRIKRIMNRYTIEVLKYDGTTKIYYVEADNMKIENNSIILNTFVGMTSVPTAVYPADKTVISKIEKINK